MLLQTSAAGLGLHAAVTHAPAARAPLVPGALAAPRCPAPSGRCSAPAPTTVVVRQPRSCRSSSSSIVAQAEAGQSVDSLGEDPETAQEANDLGLAYTAAARSVAAGMGGCGRVSRACARMRMHACMQAACGPPLPHKTAGTGTWAAMLADCALGVQLDRSRTHARLHARQCKYDCAGGHHACLCAQPRAAQSKCVNLWMEHR